MQKNYNNPYLDVEKVKEDLQLYIERTKPKLTDATNGEDLDTMDRFQRRDTSSPSPTLKTMTTLHKQKGNQSPGRKTSSSP